MGLAVALLVGVNVPAQAATTYYDVAGYTSMNGSLVTYNTSRYHSSGDAQFRMNSMQSCGGWTRIALRQSSSGYQYTKYNEYYGPSGFVIFTLAGGTGSQLAAGYYAINTTGLGAGCGLLTKNWAGTLFL